MQLPELTGQDGLLRTTLDFLLPPLCLGCGEYTEDESQICGTCLKRILFFDDPICLGCEDFIIPTGRSCSFCKQPTMKLFALGEYNSPLSDIIIHFKFKGITRPAATMADLIVQQFGERIKEEAPDYLIPVPLHRSHERTRGYNQAALLAKQLSERLDIPSIDTLIWRTKKGRPQAKLATAERTANIKDAYAAEESDERFSLILVDDVVTSGATVREAARTLEAAGHKVTAVISIAHAS